MHNLALDKCQIESFYGLLRLLIFIVSIFWHSKFCVESLSITFFNKSFSLFSSVTKYQFNSEGIYLAVVIYLLFCLDRELLLGNGLSSLPSFYPRLFLPKCITQSYHASDTWVTHPGATLPWVPETFLARFPVSVKSLKWPASPILASAYGRRCVGLRPTPKIPLYFPYPGSTAEGDIDDLRYI